MKIKITLAMLAIGASALGVGCACHRPPPGEKAGGMMGGPGMMNGSGMMGGPGMKNRRPASPLMQALDANHDGVIDAEEITNAPAALKTLDKNGDGKLTPDELRPPRPPMKGDAESGHPMPPPLPPG